VPTAPTAPTVGYIATDTQVLIQWIDLVFGDNTGLAYITSYNLYSDNGSGDNVFDEIYSGLTTSYLATGLTGGITYQFKLSATNMYGDGPFSSILSYVPQDVPNQVDIPTVAFTAPTSSATTVTISWDLPDDHSSAITIYDVEFLTATGTYVNSPD
jgi:hypothetical protein